MDSKEQLFSAYPVYSTPTTPQTPVSQFEKRAEWLPTSSFSILEPPTMYPEPKRRFWERSQPISSLLWTFFVFVIFSILHALFIYFVLLRGDIIVGATIFDASTTNLLVSIFSQASAILADTTLRQMLAALRLFFATSEKGTSAFTWFGIGLSSQWITTAQFAMASYLLNAWCLLRLTLPLLNLGFGSVLKFQADFDYYFVPSQVQLPVYAGLIPVDTKLLNVVPTADLCQYFTTWASSLQVNSRYAMETSIDGCGDDCKALLWPGGLETIRQVQPSLNISIFYGGHFEEVDAISIAHASGFATTSRPLDPSVTFDNDDDCVFGGSQIDDGFKLCVKQVGDDVAAGWVSCPQATKDIKACDKDEAWKFGPMNAQLLMGAYQQKTTTTYSRQNLSILHSVPEEEPRRFKLEVSDYSQIFNSLLVPDRQTSAAGNTSIDALTYALAWVHRVYGDMFTDEDNTLVTVLENFLTIPLQFAVVSHQLANYTFGRFPEVQGMMPQYPLPDDMITMATGGHSTQRLVIKQWTGWTFIAADAVVLLIVLVGIVCILQQDRPLPTLTGLTELDILIEAEKMICTEENSHLPLKKLPIVTGKDKSGNYTRSLRQWRMKYMNIR